VAGLDFFTWIDQMAQSHELICAPVPCPSDGRFTVLHALAKDVGLYGLGAQVTLSFSRQFILGCQDGIPFLGAQSEAFAALKDVRWTLAGLREHPIEGDHWLYLLAAPFQLLTIPDFKGFRPMFIAIPIGGGLHGEVRRLSVGSRMFHIKLVIMDEKGGIDVSDDGVIEVAMGA